MKNSIKYLYLLAILCFPIREVVAQDLSFPQDPQAVKFETSDIERFWKAYDALEVSTGNPFEKYITDGTTGLAGFIENRIINADSLRIMVEQRKADYEKVREIEPKLKALEKEIKPYFYALEYWYPYAVYPPVYFVMGRFNSGGTTSVNGLIIGAEMLSTLDHLPTLIIHESIHFQQKWPVVERTNLLQQSILEGMADFIAELVTGKAMNVEALTYGREHQDDLCREFVSRMYAHDLQDWLYSTSGKDDRPNDLGYWIGYEIVKAYFDQAEDKKLAVNHILNVEDYDRFLKESGFLQSYLD